MYLLLVEILHKPMTKAKWAKHVIGVANRATGNHYSRTRNLDSELQQLLRRCAPQLGVEDFIECITIQIHVPCRESCCNRLLCHCRNARGSAKEFSSPNQQTRSELFLLAGTDNPCRVLAHFKQEW